MIEVGMYLAIRDKLASPLRRIVSHSKTYLGAVAGYGDPLQGSCLEGFNSLGLHQSWVINSVEEFWSSKPAVRGSNPL